MTTCDDLECGSRGWPCWQLFFFNGVITRTQVQVNLLSHGNKGGLFLR